jgi:formate dehydrogenase major subunit
LPPDERPDAEYPMILTTGRILEHWHTGSMTRRSEALDALQPEAACHLAPEVLESLGLAAGGMVRLTTRRGSIVLAARAEPGLPHDVVFMPFCYAEAAANLLTNAALDPYGKIPELKFCAVRVEGE